MKIFKRWGFTLSEALITLSIIGVLAIIVLPGLIKDTMNRSMISTLISTVTNLNDAVNTELVNKRALVIIDTDIYNDPVDFFKTYLSPIKTASDNSLFASSYKTINGTSSLTSSMSASANLKNGVVVGIYAPSSNKDSSYFPMYIDINGKKGPNIQGMDYFMVYLRAKSDKETGDHAGDIGCSSVNDPAYLISNCKESGDNYCYCALERTGFDYKYLDYADLNY